MSRGPTVGENSTCKSAGVRGRHCELARVAGVERLRKREGSCEGRGLALRDLELQDKRVLSCVVFQSQCWSLNHFVPWTALSFASLITFSERCS